MRGTSVIVLLCAIVFFPGIASGQSETYEPSYRLPQGKEIVMVYLGSYDCGPCLTPELKQAIERAKVQLSNRAEEQDKSFSVVGASLGWKVQEGIEFLQSSGEFDEIIVGRNWLNSSAVRHMWKDSVVAPAIPAVVVYEHRATLMGSSLQVDSTEYLVGKVGGKSIREWVEDGVPTHP